VERALQHHPAHRAGALGVDAARAGVDRAGSAWLPRVQAVGALAARGPLPSLIIDTGLTPPGAPGPLVIERELGQTYTASVNLELGWRAVDFGGARSALRAAAQAGVHAAEHDARRRDAEIAWAVRQSYAAAAWFDALAKVTDQSIATATQAVADAEARVQAGMGAAVSVAAARSRLADLQARRAEAQAGQSQARATLGVLVGAPVEPSEPLEQLAGTAPAETTPPAVATARAAARATALQRDAVQAGFWPTLDLAASGGWADPQTFVDTESGLIWQVGARLVWAVFDGDQRARHARQLDLQRQGLEAGADAAAAQAEAGRAEADARLTAARTTITAAEARVQAAEVYLKAAQAARQAGATTRLDQQRAEDGLDAARLGVAKAHFDAARAWADRLRVEGVSQ
jgi:outer membrane protein TolC